jgi:superfamily II DNA or RNA helicase
MNIAELYNSFQFYPELDDINFQQIISKKKEFYNLTSKQTNDPDICYKEIVPRKYQKFVSIFLQNYNSLLMFHGLGTGKTRTSIYAAELLKNTTNIKNIVVLAGKSIQNNYKQTLLRVYSEKNEDKELIKEYYMINGYLEFVNRLQKLSDEDIERIYSNTLFIIDEIHNIRQDKENRIVYPKLIRLFSLIKKSKVLLMSGTPMFDKPNEIISIINLLRTNDKRIIRDDFFDNNDELLDIDDFVEYCNGYISFVKGENPETFPTKLESPKSILLLKSDYTYVIPSILSVLQENELRVVKENPELNKKDTTKVYSTQYSNIVYPNNDISLVIDNINDIMFKYKVKDNMFFTNDNIKMYAPKFYNIYENIIENPNGIHFIYSNYIQHGIIPLTLYLLQQNNFGWMNSNKQFKIATLLGETTLNMRNKIIDTLNSNENTNGELLNIILGSSVTREGLDFRGIRYIHILEPYWDFSLLNQVIGRGIRYCSHSHLPLEDRNVMIFRYVNLYNDDRISPDQELYLVSERKQIKIKKIERIMKEISVDCHINNDINNFGIDYSPDCDFSKCQITCQSNIDNIPINNDTYNYIITNDKENSNFVINVIKESYIWSRDNIHLLLDSVLTEKEIDNALYYIINNYITFKDKYNRDSYLVYYNNYFYIFPYETYNFQDDYSKIMIEPNILNNMNIRDFLKNYNIGQEFIEHQELNISINNLDMNTKKELLQSIIKKSIDNQIYMLSEDEKKFLSTIDNLLYFKKSKYFNYDMNYNIDDKILLGYSLDNINYFTYGRLQWNDKKVIFSYKNIDKFVKVDDITLNKYFELDHTGGIEKNRIKYILNIIDKTKLAKYTGFNDPVFKIIETEKSKNFGKKCNTYNKKNILDITKELSIEYNKKLNIIELCEIIEQEMKNKNTPDKIYYIDINNYSD